MEWATQWHGPEGKVHADKRTVEYTGRGNHSADAVSFVGAVSVAQALSARARRDDADRARRAPCLATPLDDAPSGATDVTSVVDATARPSRAHEPKKTRHRGKATGARKKRRVGTKNEGDVRSDVEEEEDEEEEDGDDDGDGEHELRQLPVYYFEVLVLATRTFQSDPGGAVASDNDRRGPGSYPHFGDGDDREDEEENGDEDSEMKDDEDDDDDDESDDVAMEVDLMERAFTGGGASAPWRGRARRLIHDHLRITTRDTLSSPSEGGAMSSLRRGDTTTVGENGNGTEGVTADSNSDNSSQQPSRQQQPNGNGSASSGSLVRSTSSTLSPPSPPHMTHQQLLLSFPLSSSTIHQIRLRLERQHQQTQSHRRRFSSSGSSESGTVSLTSAISSIHARQRRETVRRKRSNHRIAVGFIFSKHGGDYKRDICHEELGRQACGIALVGKTGAVLSNGQTFMQTNARFGHGDTVGCGVILDTRTFFWTINGKLVATIPVTDVHHLDDTGDHSISESEGKEWFTPWADHLLPAVSLHDNGECVRATFGEVPRERFRFDVESFKHQQLRCRQRTLSTYASAKTRNGFTVRANEEDIMHKLVEDYFVHFGYGSALSALHDLHHGIHSERILQGARSLELRHTIRKMIYQFRTREALRHLEADARYSLPHDSKVLRHCHILCVVDALYEGRSMKSEGTSTEAINTAQNVLQEYLSEPGKQSERLDEIREFMSVLLYPSVDEVPDDCPGRRFLIWAFREEVADALNEILLGDEIKPCALETLVDDLSGLQHECLATGVSPFPADESHGHASGYHPKHKRAHEHKKRRTSGRQSEDSDDDNGEVSHSSSSGASDDNDDDDDDE